MGFLGNILNGLCEDLGLNRLADEISDGMHEAVTGSSRCNNDIGNESSGEEEKKE